MREYLNLSLIPSSDNTFSGFIPALQTSSRMVTYVILDILVPETSLVSAGGAALRLGSQGAFPLQSAGQFSLPGLKCKS